LTGILLFSIHQNLTQEKSTRACEFKRRFQ
jgi:hypothetical protein